MQHRYNPMLAGHTSSACCQSLRASHLLPCRVQRGGKTNQMGHTLWTSMTHPVQPGLCGVAALAELVIYDVCKTGLPLLELIR